MATTESKVISAICRNKDIHLILADDSSLFGGYADVVDFLKEYYQRHRAVPERGLIEDKFADVDFVDTTAPSAYYLEELRSEFVGARLQGIMMKAADALDNEAPAAVLEKMNTALAKLGRYTTSVRDINLTDSDNALAHFEELRAAALLNDGSPGIATGFKSIDAFYPTGMAPGHSIVLMGFTSKGKSFWSALLAVKAWQQGKRVMVVSLEMSPEEYRERVYAMMSSGLFKVNDLSRGDVDDDAFRKWSKKEFMDANDFIVVSNQGVTEVTPNTIQAKIDVHRPDLVVLDYLQLMMDNSGTREMTPRMLNLSREVKLMAVSNNIPIISITAVTDDTDKKRDAPPRLAQVAWSKGIEYDANLAIAVHKHDNTNIVEIACRKNRHGELFGFFFEVDLNSGLWVEKFDLE